MNDIRNVTSIMSQLPWLPMADAPHDGRPVLVSALMKQYRRDAKDRHKRPYAYQKEPTVRVMRFKHGAWEDESLVLIPHLLFGWMPLPNAKEAVRQFEDLFELGC